MAVPFRRKSSTRIKKGRAPKSWAFQKRSYQARPLIKCANCPEKKILHQICSHCLTYGKLNFQEKKENKDKKKDSLL